MYIFLCKGCMYVCVLAIAGQTARLNWLHFLRKLMGNKGSKNSKNI